MPEYMVVNQQVKHEAKRRYHTSGTGDSTQEYATAHEFGIVFPPPLLSSLTDVWL